jgi:hypothetical protein
LDDGSSIIVKGLGGKKSNTVQWVRDVFMQMRQDYKDGTSPIPRLRKAFDDLEQWNIDDAENVLVQTMRLRQEPADYYIHVCI